MPLTPVVVLALSLLTWGCSQQDPLDRLIDETCAIVEEIDTGEEANQDLARLGEATERAADLGMNGEEFTQAVQERCGSALNEVRELLQAYEAEQEAQHRALADQLRIEIEKCTDDQAAGTITNTADQVIPNVGVTILLFDPDSIQMTSSHVQVGDLAPEEQRDWVAPRSRYSLPEDFEYSVATCEPVAGYSES